MVAVAGTGGSAAEIAKVQCRSYGLSDNAQQPQCSLIVAIEKKEQDQEKDLQARPPHGRSFLHSNDICLGKSKMFTAFYCGVPSDAQLQV